MTIPETEGIGRILIADDEETFARNLATFLEREGYRCETAADAVVAAGLLRSDGFDLLIADIHMPGNERLELLQDSAVAELAVLLVTGAPTLETALESMRLPVAGYILKPVRLAELKAEIDRTIQVARVSQLMARARDRLRLWTEELDAYSELARQPQVSVRTSVEAYVEGTVKNVTETLGDLVRVTAAILGQPGNAKVDLCRVMDCRRLAQYREAVDETITTIERTKRAFKSKELAVLRQKLEILKKTQDL
ncbi:MAG TPA: response regulator [Vicinamibacteria bacterium]|jgi:YesN/AraC family two-component response regulator